MGKKYGVYWRKCPAERKTEVAKLHLLEMLESIDTDEIRRRKQSAEELGVDAETLELADDRLNEIEEMMIVKEELFSALKAFSYERLMSARKAADDLELFEFLDVHLPEQIDKRAEFLLTKGEKEHALRQAIVGVNLPDVKAKLEDAITVKANPRVVAEGQARVEELTATLMEAP